MAEINYKSSGVFRLTRPEEKFPEPEPGEFAALEAAAAAFGYTLERSHPEDKLKYTIEDMLSRSEHRKLMATISVPEGRSYYDFEDLDFWGTIDLAQVKSVYELLPGFLRDLKELEGVSAEVDFELKDLAGATPTIRLRWDSAEEKLAWIEEAPEQIERITEAELYRRQSEQWAREHPDE